MGYLDIQCPGCKQKKAIAPNNKYYVCEKCATPHCGLEGRGCKVKGCNGWLREVKNDR